MQITSIHILNYFRMKNVHYVQRTFSIVVMLYALSAFTVSAKKIKSFATSTYCSDLTDTITPDSVAVKSFTAFADEKALIKVYTNDSELKIQLIAADEKTQQTWLFNGLTVYVDPIGKGSDKYAMIFPSVMSLGRPKMLPDNHEQQPNAATQDPTSGDLSSQGSDQGQQANHHPDISLIVQKMNLKGAMLDIDGDTIFAGTSLAKVSLIANQKIYYTIKLPYSIFKKKNLKPENISVGLLSEFSFPQRLTGGSGDMGGGPGGGMGGPGGGMGGPGGGMSIKQGDSHNFFSQMQQPIKGWIQVSVTHQ
jgi:uncharacterized membrane protein YgcG